MSLFCCWRVLDIWDVGSWELESDTSCHAFWHGTECPHIPGQPSQQPQIPHVTTLCQPGASGRHSRKASLSFFPHDNTSEQAAEAAEATKSWRGGRVQSAWDQKGSKFRKQYSSTRWSTLLEEKDCCIGGRHGVREAEELTKDQDWGVHHKEKSCFDASCWWWLSASDLQAFLFKQLSADHSECQQFKRKKLKQH